MPVTQIQLLATRFFYLTAITSCNYLLHRATPDNNLMAEIALGFNSNEGEVDIEAFYPLLQQRLQVIAGEQGLTSAGVQVNYTCPGQAPLQIRTLAFLFSLLQSHQQPTYPDTPAIHSKNPKTPLYEVIHCSQFLAVCVFMEVRNNPSLYHKVKTAFSSFSSSEIPSGEIVRKIVMG